MNRAIFRRWADIVERSRGETDWIEPHELERAIVRATHLPRNTAWKVIGGLTATLDCFIEREAVVDSTSRSFPLPNLYISGEHTATNDVNMVVYIKALINAGGLTQVEALSTLETIRSVLHDGIVRAQAANHSLGVIPIGLYSMTGAALMFRPHSVLLETYFPDAAEVIHSYSGRGWRTPL